MHKFFYFLFIFPRLISASAASPSVESNHEAPSERPPVEARKNDGDLPIDCSAFYEYDSLAGAFTGKMYSWNNVPRNLWFSRYDSTINNWWWFSMNDKGELKRASKTQQTSGSWVLGAKTSDTCTLKDTGESYVFKCSDTPKQPVASKGGPEWEDSSDGTEPSRGVGSIDWPELERMARSQSNPEPDPNTTVRSGQGTPTAFTVPESVGLVSPGLETQCTDSA